MCTPTTPDRYIPGGRNVRSAFYDNGGFQPFASKANFLGCPSDSWYEIGIQIGKSCGEMIAVSTDYWWIQMCEKKGLTATRNAMDRYLQAVDALDPTQVELLQGITRGAQDALKTSRSGSPEHPFHAPDFHRVFAAKGSATQNGETIASQVRHTQQAGLCYQASIVYRMAGCHIVWTVGNAPALNGLMLVNDCGLSIGHHFGGSTTEASLQAVGMSGCGSAYGVPWPNLLFYTAKTASSAAEALDILAHGNARYRQCTGRKTVLRDGTWNWMVCDSQTLAVMEASPDRHAR